MSVFTVWSFLKMHDGHYPRRWPSFVLFDENTTHTRIRFSRNNKAIQTIGRFEYGILPYAARGRFLLNLMTANRAVLGEGTKGAIAPERRDFVKNKGPLFAYDMLVNTCGPEEKS